MATKQNEITSAPLIQFTLHFSILITIVWGRFLITD